MAAHWLSDNFTPLANRPFRLLFGAQVSSLFGTGLTTIALALLAYDLAGDEAGLVLGTALALKMLAYVFFAPIAAALVADIPRRKLLIFLDVLRAAIVCCLPFISEVWQVYLLIFLLNLCSASFTPAFQATIPDILSDEKQYTRALSLSRLAYDLENILSPTIAALLLTLMSYQHFFTANGLAFIVSALLVAQVALPPRKRTEEAPFSQRLSAGVSIFIKTPRLRGLLAINLAIAAAIGMQLVNTVVYVRAELGLGEQALALVYLGLGIGSAAAAMVIPKLLERFAERLVMLTGCALMAALLALTSSAPGLLGLMLLYALMGAAVSLAQTPVGNVLRQSCDEQQRPALFAAQFSLSHAGFLICYPLAGWLSSEIGVVATYLAMGILAALSALVALWQWPANDRLDQELEHVHPEVAHEHWHSHADGHHNDHEHAQHPGDAPHKHPHVHPETRHKHKFVIDMHHTQWPH